MGKTKTQKRKRNKKNEILSTEMLRFLSAECHTVSLGALLITFCRLAMGGLFSTEVYSENRTFDYHKTVKRRRNPAYCQCAVTSSFSHLSSSGLYIIIALFSVTSSSVVLLSTSVVIFFQILLCLVYPPHHCCLKIWSVS